LNDPEFTAVIPAYNAAATLATAIESVLAQTRENFELVVVDDGATDDTYEVARPYEQDPRVTVIRQENRGLPAARNTGIRTSSGGYIGFLDSDDLWMPTYLERMGEALDSQADAGLAYTDAWSLDEISRRVRRASAMDRYLPSSEPPSEPEALLALLVKQNFFFVGTMVRRAVLPTVGTFNETLRAAEDYELWLRILAHRYRAVRVPGRLAVRLERPDSMSRDALRMRTALREVWRLVEEEHPAPEDIKAEAARRRAMIERQIAAESGGRAGPTRARRARRAVGRLASRFASYRSPPPEVAEAFPDLDLRR